MSTGGTCIMRALVLPCLFALSALAPARAETTTCTKIDAVPATIAQQGVYCLARDLSTSIASGYAIDIQANNVTIDCNGHRLGDLAAGPGTYATGIRSWGRRNIVVRNCTVRGFESGISLDGSGGGHLVEDNLVDQSIVIGIGVVGEDSLVRRNRVFDTGGGDTAFGISAMGDVDDNVVSGVVAGGGANNFANGITIQSASGEVRGNQIRGVAVQGSGEVRAIQAIGASITVRDNTVIGATATTGWGVYGNGDGTCLDNTVLGFSTSLQGCQTSVGNVLRN
jgi:hypothetical protein